MLFSSPVATCVACSRPVKPFVEVQECTSVVIDGTTLGHMLQLGAKLRYAATRDILGQVPCVGTDIAPHSRPCRLLGIVAPNGVIAALELDTLRKPALRVLDEDTAYAADIAALDALLGLLDGGITAVYVRKGASVRPSR